MPYSFLAPLSLSTVLFFNFPPPANPLPPSFSLSPHFIPSVPVSSSTCSFSLLFLHLLLISVPSSTPPPPPFSSHLFFLLLPQPMELASRRPDNGSPYTVRIKFIREIPPSDTQFLQVSGCCFSFLPVILVTSHLNFPLIFLLSLYFDHSLSLTFSTCLRTILLVFSHVLSSLIIIIYICFTSSATPPPHGLTLISLLPFPR